MVNDSIRFEDGAAYERYMGTWSRLAGGVFLDWLAPQVGWRWLDVGCGSGAFTEEVVQRCTPASVEGLDPSPAQLAFARRQLPADNAHFREGDAMSLPYARGTFDAAVMPLVIFFVPDPARGVAEMVRVVRPGGTVAAYGWDLGGGGFPYEALRSALGDMGVDVPQPPSPDAARLDTLRALWAGAELEAVETRAIHVQRTFADFDEYWSTILLAPSMGPRLSALPSADLARLALRMRAILLGEAGGRISCTARANAVKGRVRTSPRA